MCSIWVGSRPFNIIQRRKPTGLLDGKRVGDSLGANVVGGVGEVHPALLEESRTRGIVRVCEVGNPVRSFENHDQASSRRGGEKSRSLHYAPPDFLLRFVTSANSMRLSLLKAAPLLKAAWQEIRVRFGRDDKSEGSAST